MQSNKGKTTLKCRPRRINKMQEFDRLPEELRVWVATAKLPWRAGSVQTAYKKALRRTDDPARALQELDRLQNALIAKDARKIWGAHHPAAEPKA